jgi:hypothetical protein
LRLSHTNSFTQSSLEPQSPMSPLP